MSILANNINEEIREILKEHNNNIDKKIEEQNQKNKDLKESINKSYAISNYCIAFVGLLSIIITPCLIIP